MWRCYYIQGESHPNYVPPKQQNCETLKSPELHSTQAWLDEESNFNDAKNIDLSNIVKMKLEQI